MVHWLASVNKLDLLHAGANRLEFWRRFSRARPDHPIYSQNINMNRAIPMLCHGDEGRSKKKRALLVWSMKGAVGSGSVFFKDLPAAERDAQMGLNLDN